MNPSRENHMSRFKTILVTSATLYLKAGVTVDEAVLGYQPQDSAETLIRKLGLAEQ